MAKLGSVGSREPPLPATDPGDIARAKKLLPVMERIVGVKEADARAPFMMGLLSYKAGLDKESREWFKRCLDQCRTQKGDRVLHPATTQLIVGVARLADFQGWKELIQQSADDYLYVNEDAGLWNAEFVGNERACPPLLWAKRLLDKPVAYFEWYQRVGSWVFARSEGLYTAFKEKHKADVVEKALLEHVTKKPSSEAYRALAWFIGLTYQDVERAARLLAKAREQVTDAKIDFEAARLYMQARKPAEALACIERAAKLAEEGKDADLEEAVGLYRARVHLAMENRAAAKAAVDRLFERGRTSRDAHIAEVCEYVGMPEEARKRYVDLLGRGFAPYVHLGRVHEALSNRAGDEETRRKHAVEAVKYYAAAARLGSFVTPWPPEEEILLSIGMEGVSPDSSAGRMQMMALLGQDYFVKPFLSKKFEPLSPEVEREARAQWKVLTDPAADNGARMRAIEAIRAAGPRVTPIIKEGLQSEDGWLKNAVTELVQEWSIPEP